MATIEGGGKPNNKQYPGRATRPGASFLYFWQTTAAVRPRMNASLESRRSRDGRNIYAAGRFRGGEAHRENGRKEYGVPRPEGHAESIKPIDIIKAPEGAFMPWHS